MKEKASSNFQCLFSLANGKITVKNGLCLSQRYIMRTDRIDAMAAFENVVAELVQRHHAHEGVREKSFIEGSQVGHGDVRLFDGKSPF